MIFHACDTATTDLNRPFLSGPQPVEAAVPPKQAEVLTALVYNRILWKNHLPQSSTNQGFSTISCLKAAEAPPGVGADSGKV